MVASDFSCDSTSPVELPVRQIKLVVSLREEASLHELWSLCVYVCLCRNWQTQVEKGLGQLEDS